MTNQMQQAVQLGHLLSKDSASWTMDYKTSPEVVSEYVIKVYKSVFFTMYNELSTAVQNITKWTELCTFQNFQNLADDAMVTIHLHLNFKQTASQLDIKIL